MVQKPDLSGFGSFSVLRPLTGGHRAQVWLVGRGGDLFVAKSTRRTEDQLRWLAPLQAQARRAGFVVPGLIPAASGQLSVGGWTLEPFLPGTPMMRSAFWRLVPKITVFQRLAAPIGQRPGFLSLPELMFSDSGGDIDLGALPKKLVPALRAAWAEVTHQPVCAIHGDLTPANMIQTDTGPALIDWDEARVDLRFLDRMALPGRSALEIRAHLAREIAVGWLYEPDHARALLQRFTPAAQAQRPRP